MNEEKAGKCVRQVEHIRGHLWHRYSKTMMVVTVKRSIWFWLIWFIVLNVIFSNALAISWRPVLVVEEDGAPGENHRPWASNW